MFGRRLHFGRIGILHLQYVARELDHGALHTQTDAHERHAVLAGILHGLDLPLDAAVSEARRHEDAGHPAQYLVDVRIVDLLRIDVTQLDPAVVHRAGMDEGFADRLVGIGQFGIFSHQRDLDLVVRILDLLHESLPLLHIGFAVGRKVEFREHHLVQMLIVHTQRHLVDRRHVDRFHHGVGVDVAEERHLAAKPLRQRPFGAEHQDVGLQTVFHQCLDRMLRRLGLQLARSGHVGDQRQVHERRIAVAERIAQLAHRLDEGQRLDVAHRAAQFGDDDVVDLLLRQQLNAPLDLVGDMGDDLHGLAQVIAAALLFDDAFIDFARGDVVGLRGGDRRKALVVPQIEVGLRTVFGDVALAVLVGVERPGINVDVRVELLDGHRIAACLQQAGDRCRDDAFAQRRSHAAGNKDVLRFFEFHILF